MRKHVAALIMRCVVQPQRVADVFHNRLRGRRRQRQRASRFDLRPCDVSDLQKGRPEIVGPLADAVGLVDYEERTLDGLEASV